MDSQHIGPFVHGIHQNNSNDFSPEISFPVDKDNHLFKNPSSNPIRAAIKTKKMPNKLDNQIKLKTKNNDKTQIINSFHHFFFFPLKSKNAKSSLYFLYNYPLICIYTKTVNYPEFEIISPSTSILIEDRFLILNEDSSHKKYHIKLDKEAIDNILNNAEDSKLAQYLKCYSIIPELEPCFLINQFYYPSIFNSHYLLAFSECGIYDDAFLELWLAASEYVFEPIFGHLIQCHFKTTKNPLFENNTFLKFISMTLFRNDQEFQDFIEETLTPKSISIDTYLRAIMKLPFSPHSYLLLHLVYQAAMNFNHQQTDPYQVVGQFLYFTAILPNFKYPQTQKRIENLHMFNHDNIPIKQLERFKSFLSKFRLYPVDFDDPVFDNSHFTAFLDLENQYRIHTSNFLEAVRKTANLAEEKC